MNTNNSYEMTPNSWIPRQVRLGEKLSLPLRNNISDSEQALRRIRSWIGLYEGVLNNDDIEQFIDHVGTDDIKSSDYFTPSDAWRQIVGGSEEGLLDGIEFILYKISQNFEDAEIIYNDTVENIYQQLNKIFLDHNINYQLSPEIPYHLMHRVLPSTQEYYNLVLQDTDSLISNALLEAIKYAYSRNPNPELAWRDAQAAIERMFVKTVSKDKNGQWGKALGNFKEAVSTGKWKSGFPTDHREESAQGQAVAQFIKFLDLIYYSPQRHLNDHDPADIIEAKAMVSLAVALCQMLHDGVIYKIDTLEK
jgi:hypothetical protein